VSMLAPQITHIVHAAATTQFHLPLACARLVNYTGTRNVLAFAHDVREFGCLRHVAHISTAYVCGTRCGRIAEGDATAGATACSNSYEQSKCEAEGLARAAMRELPVSIFRPSIVVGDSQTGRATAFNALYAPLRLIQRGLISALPAFPGIPVDVVPTDYTSEVLRHILLQARAVPGMTYHLVAGPDRSSTVAEIIGEAIHHFNRHTTGTLIPPVQFIPPELWGTLHHHDDTARSSPAKAVGIYAPYTCLPRSFDDRNTRQALKGTSIRPPRLMDYYDRILEYCLKTAWGRTLRRAA
jgi:thioester reductase-like protein